MKDDMKVFASKMGFDDIETGMGTPDDTYEVQIPGGTQQIRRLPSPVAEEASCIKGQWYPSTDPAITSQGTASGPDYDAGNVKKIMNIIAANGDRPAVINMSGDLVFKDEGFVWPQNKTLDARSGGTIIIDACHLELNCGIMADIRPDIFELRNGGTVGGDFYFINTPTVPTVAASRKLTGSERQTIRVSGYHEPNEGGGGPVRICLPLGAPGTYVDNKADITVPDGGDGSKAWGWVWNGPVDIRDAGAMGDEINDDSDAVITLVLHPRGVAVNASPGKYRITKRIDLSQAADSGYNIAGTGESSMLIFEGAAAGFYDKYWSGTGYDDKGLGVCRDLYLKGDGTNTGFLQESTYHRWNNVTFDGFRVGFETPVGYEGRMTSCHFKNNVDAGVFLNPEDIGSVTQIEFHKCYFRGHSTGPAVKIRGRQEFVRFVGGSIEGNPGGSVYADDNFSGTVVFDGVYMEVNGSESGDVRNIRFPAAALETMEHGASGTSVRWENCKISKNNNMGKNDFGYGASLRNCWLGGDAHFGYDCSVEDTAISSSVITSDGPVYFSGKNRFTYGGSANSNGFVLQIPTSYDNGVLLDKCENLISVPFAAGGTLPIKATGSTPPSVTLGATSFCGKNVVDVDFVENVAMAWGVNTIKPDVAIIIPAKTWGVCSLLMRTDAGAVTMKSIFSGGIAICGGEFTIDDQWRRFVFIGFNRSDTSVDNGLLIGPAAAITSVPGVRVTGVFVAPVAANHLTDVMASMLTGKIPY